MCKMRWSHVGVLVSATMLLVIGVGCQVGAGHPPRQMPATNARLDGYEAIYATRIPETVPADTVILTARGAASCAFACRRRGDWEEHWQQERLDVIAVEQGTWHDRELTFITMSMWPTPESGILLSIAPWPYRRGVELRFWLDPRTTPARIIGQQTLHDPWSVPASGAAPPEPDTAGQ